MTNGDWTEADELDTTYYGDPDPPEPDCEWCGIPEEGGEEDPPEMLMMTGGASGGGDSAGRGAYPNGVAVPSPRTDADVIANFVSGIKRLRLDKRPGYEGFTLTDGSLSVASVVRVRSLGDFPDYSIVSLADSSGRIVVKGTVDARGLLGVIKRLGGSDDHFSVIDAGTARAFAARAGVQASTSVVRVVILGSTAGDVFSPLFFAKSDDGRQILVGGDGSVHAVVRTEKGKVSPKRGAVHVAARGHETWVLTELRKGSRAGGSK
jgi:hypothetical protein